MLDVKLQIWHKDHTNKQKENKMKLEVNENWQTKARGTNEQEFEIFLANADDGNGRDITRNLAPLPTFDEWMNR